MYNDCHLVVFHPCRLFKLGINHHCTLKLTDCKYSDKISLQTASNNRKEKEKNSFFFAVMDTK